MPASPRPLYKVRGVKQLGRWLQDHGISPGENAFFGGVHPVHTSTSLHYQKDSLGNFPSDKQGNLALDVNDRGVADSWFWVKRIGKWVKWKPESEHQSLSLIYHRIHQIAQAKDWPLNEMFFNGFGFVKERGYNVNHAIGGHDGHLHIGFDRVKW